MHKNETCSFWQTSRVPDFCDFKSSDWNHNEYTSARVQQSNPDKVIFSRLVTHFKLSFNEENLLSIIFLLRIFDAWAFALAPVICRFLFDEKYYGFLIGIKRFILGITRFFFYLRTKYFKISKVFRRLAFKKSRKNLEKMDLSLSFIFSLLCKC